MNSQAVVAALALAAALALLAPGAAAPLPSGGAFPYRGQPMFVSGFYAGLDPTQVSIYLASVDGYVLERFYRTPTGASGSDVILGRAATFQCLDDLTFLFTANYTSYSLRSDGPPSATPRALCSLHRLEGGILRTASFHIDGTDGTDDTDVNAIIKSSFKNVPSGIQLPAVTCVNKSITEGWAGAAPLPLNPPSLPSGTPCATHPSPGGPPITAGVWGLSNGGGFGVETPQVWADSEWAQDPKQIGGSVEIYTSHRCLSPDTADVASYAQQFFLNGTVNTFWSCLTKTRCAGPGGVATLRLQGDGVMDTTFSLVQELPGNASTVCPLGPIPSPSPKPPGPGAQKCTWRGIWRISAAAAPCRRHHITHAAYNCANSSVVLRTRPELFGQPQRLEWGLNHSYYRKTKIASSGNIKAAKDFCPLVNLSGPRVPKDPALSLRARTAFKFRIIPVSAASCTEVYLKAVDGPGDRDYLTVPRSCKGFVWAKNRSARAVFRLAKVSELLP